MEQGKPEQNKSHERQAAIKSIIGAHKISDHQALLELLDKEFNIQTSQAVISRDLRSLGVVKKSVNGQLIYDNVGDPDKELLRRAITSIARNDAIIVINTLSGCAAFVGDYIDAHKHLGILGTLAGENVVFITPISTHDIERVFLSIKNLTYTF